MWGGENTGKGWINQDLEERPCRVGSHLGVLELGGAARLVLLLPKV